jgi:ribosome-binding factor A
MSTQESSRRSMRMADLVRETLGKILLQELRDPGLQQAVITRVKMNRDLSLARILYTIPGAQPDKAAAHHALNRAKGFCRKALAEELNLRYAPRLEFFYDEGLAHERHIEDILRNLSKPDSL